MTCNAKLGRFSRTLLVSAACAALMGLYGCGGDDDDGGAASDSGGSSGPAGVAAAKATCGSGDNAEKDLQGQVSAATRTAGFKGNNCNLQLVGQYRGEGASWQHAWFQDRAGHLCNYYDTSANTANRTNLGVVV